MSIQSTIKETEKELKDMKCSGPRCNHETADEHYLVDESFLKQSQLNLLKAVVERIKTEEIDYSHQKDTCEECLRIENWNCALISVSSSLETIINELK